MNIVITEQQLKNLNIIYTGIFVDQDKLLKKFPPVHKNIFYHHVTLAFKPKDVKGVPFGETTKIKIIGRLTTDKVDALLVNVEHSNNEFPHITLSTAEGVKPVASNSEIKENQDKIKTINDTIDGVYGFFDGQKVVTNVDFL